MSIYAWNPEEEPLLVHDECPVCGAFIGDDTELFFAVDPHKAVKCDWDNYIGCEECITGRYAYDLAEGDMRFEMVRWDSVEHRYVKAKQPFS